MLKFDCETISHSQQRYPTVGDYATDSFGTTHFKISDVGNWKYEFLVAVHEVIEKYLCKAATIMEIDIDTFDLEYEKNRKPQDVDEPGNDPKAPYYRQHQVATFIEKQLAREMGVDWDEYEKTLDNLYLLYSNNSLNPPQ
jgi:hypothetical protein